MVSDVFFTDMHTSPQHNLLQKLEKLIEKAGIKKIDFQNKFTAIKIHFGEYGNMAYLRPPYAATIADYVKKQGGHPFLTDSNTLYSGERSNALDHLNCAARNGYTREVLGCPIIIADGLKGTEYREIEIDQKHCVTAKISSAIADADVLISISHFKGHMLAGFGGCLKNLAMGCASRGGKLQMHSSSKPHINAKTCVRCLACLKNCPQKAIYQDQKKTVIIDHDRCIGCGECVAMCRYSSVLFDYNEKTDTMNEKMAEYAYAAVKDKPHFHVNLIIDVSPGCDCAPFNNQPICPNIGLLASFDPVALDKASVDLVNKAAPIADSELKNYKHGEDKFHNLSPHIRWEKCLDHAEKIGIGSQKYKLIKI